jgi:PRTRC genetic system protein E
MYRECLAVLSHYMTMGPRTESLNPNKMFQELMPILDKVDLVITLSSLDGAEITAAIVPRVKEGKTLDIIPLVLVATPEEFDTEFVKAIAEGLTSKLGVINNIAEFQKNVEKKNTSNTAKPVTASASPTAPGGTTTGAPVLKEVVKKDPEIRKPGSHQKTELKAYNELMAVIERIDKATDPDMIAFLRKEAHAKGALIKSQDKTITEAINFVIDKKLNGKGEHKQETVSDGIFAATADLTDKQKANVKASTKKAETKPKEKDKPSVPPPPPVVEDADASNTGHETEVDVEEDNDTSADIDDEDEDAEEEIVDDDAEQETDVIEENVTPEVDGDPW